MILLTQFWVESMMHITGIVFYEWRLVKQYLITNNMFAQDMPLKPVYK